MFASMQAKHWSRFLMQRTCALLIYTIQRSQLLWKICSTAKACLWACCLLQIPGFRNATWGLAHALYIFWYICSNK